MPSKTPAQRRLMAGVAHNPSFAKKVGIPQSVGKDFNEADRMKKRKFAEGGEVVPPKSTSADIGRIMAMTPASHTQAYARAQAANPRMPSREQSMRRAFDFSEQKRAQKASGIKAPYRVTPYAEGGEVTYGEDERPAPSGMGEIAEGMRDKPKQSFKEAFKVAEKGSTFEWNGKKYKKEFASDKPKPKTGGVMPKGGGSDSPGWNKSGGSSGDEPKMEKMAKISHLEGTRSTEPPPPKREPSNAKSGVIARPSNSKTLLPPPPPPEPPIRRKMSGKVTDADMAHGGAVKGYASGGIVRGTGAAKSGKKFSGTY